MEFQPRAGGEAWTADLHMATEHNGYDVVLFLDKVAKTEDSGWMLELAIDPDGTVAGQITAHPGFDALAVFTCTQDTLSLWEGSTVPSFVITDGPNKPAMSTADKLEIAMKALRDIHRDGSPVSSYTARMALEKIGVSVEPRLQ